MKKITIINLGFYHPSVANWNYHIWLIIDDTGAKLYREVFGGDSRLREKMKRENIEVKTLSIKEYAKFKWADVKDMIDIEKYNGKNYEYNL